MPRHIILLAISAAASAVIACGSSSEADPMPLPGSSPPTSTPAATPTAASDTSGPPSSPPPRPVDIVFPADEGTHEDALEWWYYNGHLSSDSGREFGFHFVIFQARRRGFPLAYVGQMGITDVAGADHIEGSTFFLGNRVAAAGEDAGVFALSSGEWSLSIGDGGHEIAGRVPDGSISLALEAQGPAALHNGIGWLSGPLGWTYYYSWPRMGASGTVVLGGEEFRVAGSGWMDHQWGDFDVPRYPAGWQWFAVQLDDGSELMLSKSRDEMGATTDFFGTYTSAGGESRALTPQADGIAIDETARWTSPNTGGEYPASWRIVIDSLGLEMELTPVVADQEIPATALTPIVYWEGKVTVSASRPGANDRVESIGGQGYVELTGYAKPDVPAVEGDLLAVPGAE